VGPPPRRPLSVGSQQVDVAAAHVHGDRRQRPRGRVPGSSQGPHADRWPVNTTAVPVPTPRAYFACWDGYGDRCAGARFSRLGHADGAISVEVQELRGVQLRQHRFTERPERRGLSALAGGCPVSANACSTRCSTARSTRCSTHDRRRLAPAQNDGADHSTSGGRTAAHNGCPHASVSRRRARSIPRSAAASRMSGPIASNSSFARRNIVNVPAASTVSPRQVHEPAAGTALNVGAPDIPARFSPRDRALQLPLGRRCIAGAQAEELLGAIPPLNAHVNVSVARENPGA